MSESEVGSWTKGERVDGMGVGMKKDEVVRKYSVNRRILGVGSM